jgi:multiple sugar transport system permease protein
MKSFFDFEKSEKKLAFILVAPTIVVVFAVLLYPIIYSFILSFGDVQFTHIERYNFIGIANYIRAFVDSSFINSLKVTIIFLIGVVTIKTILGTLIAVILKEKFIGRSIARALIIIPWATPFIVVGIIWKWMLNAEVGLINYLLLKIGIIDKYISFLASDHLALPSVMLADIWQGTAFFVIIILSGLQTIPDDIYEAARIDGAGGIKSFFLITIPLVRYPILISIVIGTIFSINAFDLFYLLTRGGPGNITTNTTLYAWNSAFRSGYLSFGIAISYLILILAICIAMFYIYILKKSEYR